MKTIPQKYNKKVNNKLLNFHNSIYFDMKLVFTLSNSLFFDNLIIELICHFNLNV